MPQRYKLRLGDGTVLAVDQDGLKTWVEDRRAVAQAVGTQKWRPLREVVAEAEAAARLERALVPPKPRQEATPPPPEPQSSPVSPPFELPSFSEPPAAVPSPPLFDEPFAAPSRQSFSEPPDPVPSRPSLQVLADEPVSSSYADSATPRAQLDNMPVIRMKPLDDEGEPFIPAVRSTGPEADDYEFEEDEPSPGGLEGPLFTVLNVFGGLLSRCLDPLTPLVARFSSRESEAPAPPRVDAAPRGVPRKTAVSADPEPKFLTLADDPGSAGGLEDDRRRSADGPTLYSRVSGWLSGLRARFERAPAPAEPPAPRREPAVSVPRTPAPRQPVPAPTPISQLPALRFVETREPRESEDVFEGEAGPSIFLPVWLWTQRIVVVGALAAGVGYAVLERDTWFPRAAALGQTMFTEIDRQVLSRERTERQRRALADASERLPQLAPETIQLVFSRSPGGVVDPPEVFELTREAAERGQAALAPAEAEELRALQQELLGTLRSTERARIREYDETRARRMIFPFENPHVMDLVALGARSLPPERRARLQQLSHKAVVAGLDLPAGAAGEGAAR